VDSIGLLAKMEKGLAGPFKGYLLQYSYAVRVDVFNHEAEGHVVFIVHAYCNGRVVFHSCLWYAEGT
ncbi:hypothetical protein Leryth_021503, partial [Lithospermum erythrorhizon]